MAVSPFANIAKAKIGVVTRDPFLQCNNVVRDLTKDEKCNIISCDDAEYIIRCDGVEYSGTRKAGDKFKSKLAVMWGNGPSAKDIKVNPDGSIFNPRAVYMVMAKSEYFDRDVLRYMCALTNSAPKPFVNSQGQPFPGWSNSDMEIVISARQPLTGMYAHVKVHNNKGKDAPHRDFTNHQWTPILPIKDAAGNIVDWARPAVNNMLEWQEANQNNPDER